MEKSYTVIGGADGPTSIFLAGNFKGHKEKNIIKTIKRKILNKKFNIKRKKAAKLIVPNPHTIEQTIQYIKQHYHAVEADCSYPYFNERKLNMKYLLIRREKPELLGEEKKIAPPKDFNNIELVKEWQKSIEEWNDECLKKTESISDKVFPTNYHLFLINKKEDGTLEIELDTLYPNISISYSGNKKILEPILKNIYMYYGVSKKDIHYKTERYKTLLSILSS